ncbi:MAG: hypothetical protein L6Q29_00065 [Candidatus Pacebacteria bacterium]|nr:hypothetical protein [Candidatus Paceibacterota bacterium]NUQ57625.1 hypothetical protein [Candidatus Paceibacter sp.]
MKKIDGFVALATGEIVEDGGSLEKGFVVLKNKKIKCRPVYENEIINMTTEAIKAFIHGRTDFYPKAVLRGVEKTGSGIMVKVFFSKIKKEQVFSASDWKFNWNPRF